MYTTADLQEMPDAMQACKDEVAAIMEESKLAQTARERVELRMKAYMLSLSAGLPDPLGRHPGYTYGELICMGNNNANS